MPLPIPQLDDRSYQDLLNQALDNIHNDLHTDWNDLSPGDPGVVLLETFAFLTEQMIYRLNRVPEKAYIAFLNMLGVGLKPPNAAKVELSFWRDSLGEGDVLVPGGTQVASESRSGDAIVFTTVEDVNVSNENKTQETAKKVMAYNAIWVEEVLSQQGNGLPGQEFTVSKPPILAGVKGLEMEVRAGILESDATRKGKAEGGIETWVEVDNFAGVGENEKVYRVDRQTGTIHFAPAAFLPEVPKSKVERLMGLAHTRVQDMSQMIESGRTPPDRVIHRLERHLQQALWLCRYLDDMTLDRTLRQLRAQLEKQERVMKRLQPHASQIAKPVLEDIRTILKKQLQATRDGLKNHEMFRYPADGQHSDDPHPLSHEKIILAAVPPKGSLIHVRYPIGGGAGGNISREMLKVIQSPDLQTKLKVTNLEPARGGMDAETLENALVRGPQEVFTQKRLITARDFERTVLDRWRPNFARARAYALQELWEHAAPGTVSISLAPRLGGSDNPTAITKEALESEQARLDKENLKGEIIDALKVESPLGIHALRAEWARYKTVTVNVEATISRGGNAGDVQKRLRDKLYHTITTPKSEETPDGREWEGRDFGAELRWAEVLGWAYESAENDISQLGKLELKLDSAPDREITSLAADYFQAETWYAASGQRLFRTTNNAGGWEELLDFTSGKSTPSLFLEKGMENPPGGQMLKKVCSSRYKPGLVALSGLAIPAQPADQPHSYVYLSTDCGESWSRITDIDAEIDDMDWLLHAGRHILLLATSNGLKKLYIDFDKGNNPRPEIYPVPIDKGSVSLPVYAVKVLDGIGGTTRVAVALGGRRGVYLSEGMDLNAFTKLEHDNTDRVQPDIRCLGLQWSEQDNCFLLWAGGMALGPTDNGCCRWVLDQQLNLVSDQSQYLQEQGKGRWLKDGWVGGSCLGLAFLDYRVLVATSCGSILWADVTPPTRDAHQKISAWQTFGDSEDTLPRRMRFGESTRTVRAYSHELTQTTKAHTQELTRATEVYANELSKTARMHADELTRTAEMYADELTQTAESYADELAQTAEAYAREEHIPFTAIASNDRLKNPPLQSLVLAGCGRGVFLSRDRGETFSKVSRVVFSAMNDAITIPPNWLLVSGSHDIRINEEKVEDHGAG